MSKATLLIMAAGLGSRYGGNKQVDGIGPHGEILMQYSIYDAIRAGFDKLVFVIKPEHQAIVESFCRDIKGVEISFVYQDFTSIPSFYTIPAERVKPFGTVHAVLCAKEAVKEPFAVINADDFYGADAFSVMYDELMRLKAGEATMVAYYLKNTVSRNGAVTRGVCGVKNGKLAEVVETYKITAITSRGSRTRSTCRKLPAPSPARSISTKILPKRLRSGTTLGILRLDTWEKGCLQSSRKRLSELILTLRSLKSTTIKSLTRPAELRLCWLTP